MRITPLDVRKQEFRKGMRGLDPEEVYAFLATVADEYETVLTDNRQLRDRVLELDEKVTEYRNMEKTLRDTLLTAERVMAEARENARKEAELILRDARGRAQQHFQDSSAQAESLKQQLRELRSQRDAFLARLRGLAEAQIGLVDSFARDFQEDDRARSNPMKTVTPQADPAQDRWRDYEAGEMEGPAPEALAEEVLARTVAEMAQAAGAESGQGPQTVPPSPNPGEELPANSLVEMPEEEPATMASAEESEESQEGSRWSIARFTRSLSEF
jgi:cell division initiation protein